MDYSWQVISMNVTLTVLEIVPRSERHGLRLNIIIENRVQHRRPLAHVPHSL